MLHNLKMFSFSVKFLKLFFTFLIFAFLIGCNGLSKTNTRDVPVNAQERARKNIEEGRGASVGSMLGGIRGATNYEFSSSNPMWRASLETLDFLPLTTVDYSGGVIITDWYSQSGNQDSIKLTVRFLSNEIRSDSLKIIVHKKICKTSSNCATSISKSNLIKDELRSTILRKAALLEKSDKEKK